MFFLLLFLNTIFSENLNLYQKCLTSDSKIECENRFISYCKTVSGENNDQNTQKIKVVELTNMNTKLTDKYAIGTCSANLATALDSVNIYSYNPASESIPSLENTCLSIMGYKAVNYNSVVFLSSKFLGYNSSYYLLAECSLEKPSSQEYEGLDGDELD